MFPSYSSSSSTLFSAIAFVLQFMHYVPRQSPQAATQFSPLARQEQLLPPHGFLDVKRQLQRITFNNSSRAGDSSVMIDTKLFSSSLQPQSS